MALEVWRFPPLLPGSIYKLVIFSFPKSGSSGQSGEPARESSSRMYTSLHFPARAKQAAAALGDFFFLKKVCLIGIGSIEGARGDCFSIRDQLTCPGWLIRWTRPPTWPFTSAKAIQTAKSASAFFRGQEKSRPADSGRQGKVFHPCQVPAATLCLG